MKYFLSFFLVLVLLAGFASCDQPEAVTYYYLRDESNYISGTANGIIVGEIREAASSVHDLQNLLILYLHGPSNESFRSPFPRGTTLIRVEQTSTSLVVHLSREAASLKNTELTLACACMAQTCFALTPVDSVTITADDMSMTMTRNSILLVDDTVDPQS